MPERGRSRSKKNKKGPCKKASRSRSNRSRPAKRNASRAKAARNPSSRQLSSTSSSRLVLAKSKPARTGPFDRFVSKIVDSICGAAQSKDESNVKKEKSREFKSGSGNRSKSFLEKGKPKLHGKQFRDKPTTTICIQSTFDPIEVANKLALQPTAARFGSQASDVIASRVSGGAAKGQSSGKSRGSSVKPRASNAKQAGSAKPKQKQAASGKAAAGKSNKKALTKSSSSASVNKKKLAVDKKNPGSPGIMTKIMNSICGAAQVKDDRGSRGDKNRLKPKSKLPQKKAGKKRPMSRSASRGKSSKSSAGKKRPRSRSGSRSNKGKSSAGKKRPRSRSASQGNRSKSTAAKNSNCGPCSQSKRSSRSASRANRSKSSGRKKKPCFCNGMKGSKKRKRSKTRSRSRSVSVCSNAKRKKAKTVKRKKNPDGTEEFEALVYIEGGGTDKKSGKRSVIIQRKDGHTSSYQEE